MNFPRSLAHWILILAFLSGAIPALVYVFKQQGENRTLLAAAAPAWFVIAVAVVDFIFVLFHAIYCMGVERAGVFCALSTIIAFIFEFLGSHFGILSGKYSYSGT